MASLGLSPCVRGYLLKRVEALIRAGSIPVCTGLPRLGRPKIPVLRVYPRVYGATGWKEKGLIDTEGLSPCVRGYRSALTLTTLSLRSIPVCTGLPFLSLPRCISRWVYPRVYGATDIFGGNRLPGEGLSPCVRGYRLRIAPRDPRPGSIPVCTGLPRPRPRRLCAKRVYPRVYGATSPGSSSPCSTLGLSPCVRGYRVHEEFALLDGGSIPVCTGLPSSMLLSMGVSGVYPRVYGATVLYGSVHGGSGGLSPCVRGYPCYKVSPFRHGKSIFFPSTLFLRHFVAGKVGLRRATCSPTAT